MKSAREQKSHVLLTTSSINLKTKKGNVYLFVENADHILIEGQDSKEQSVQNNPAAPGINRCPFLIFMKDDLGSIETPAQYLREHFIGA
jgi:hypothetical protein